MMRGLFIEIIAVVVLILSSSTVVKAQLYSDSITVNFFMLDECKISQNMTAEINALYSEFNNEFSFMSYWPNFSSKPDNIKKFEERYRLELPSQTDYYKTQAKKYGATVAPEVVVYDEGNNKFLYRGRIDNSYEKIGQRRRVVTDRSLYKALSQIKSQSIITEPITIAIGCFINFKEL